MSGNNVFRCFCAHTHTLLLWPCARRNVPRTLRILENQTMAAQLPNAFCIDSNEAYTLQMARWQDKHKLCGMQTALQKMNSNRRLARISVMHVRRMHGPRACNCNVFQSVSSFNFVRLLCHMLWHAKCLVSVVLLSPHIYTSPHHPHG